jgi:acetyl esterase/lipase
MTMLRSFLKYPDCTDNRYRMNLLKLLQSVYLSMRAQKHYQALILICITSAVTLGCSQSSSSTGNNVSSGSSSQSSSSLSSASPFQLSYGGNVMQVGDFRMPAAATNGPVPLVIIVHGGCWISAYADFHSMDRFAEAITALGYATWNIEYRAIGTGGEWPVIFQDIGNAIDYSYIIAQQHNVDLNKVAVIGHSAGGHLALWAAGRSKILPSSLLYKANPLMPRGVISLGGIADLTRDNSCYSATSAIIGFPLDSTDVMLSARLHETSPQQMLPLQIPSILITGSADNIIPPQISIDYVAAAIALGDNSSHYSVNGAGHFELIEPERTDWLLYQQSLQSIFNN